MSATLDRLEAIIDSSGVARQVEALLAVGVRPRQLSVRTLLTGMLLVAVHGRPAHLRRVHQALLDLDAPDQHRLAIITQWRTGPHLLTYRQVERTFGLIAAALGKPTPDGTPSETLSNVLDALLEASVQVLGEPASSSYAVDWTDLETWSGPPHKPRAERPDDTTPGDEDQDDRRCADPEASWGHRRGQPSRPKRRAVLRLLPPSRHDRQRRARPPGPRARPADASGLLRSRPARRDSCPSLSACTTTPSRSQTCSLDSGYAYRIPKPGRSPSARSGSPRPGSPPQRPRPARHPPRRDLLKREPLLPRHPTSPAQARTARARRHTPANRHA